MTYLSCTRIPGGSVESYRELLAALPTSPPQGLLARYAGVTGDALVITAVWASKAHRNRFATEILPPVAGVVPRAPDQQPAVTVEYEVAEHILAERTAGPR